MVRASAARARPWATTRTRRSKERGFGPFFSWRGRSLGSHHESPGSSRSRAVPGRDGPGRGVDFRQRQHPPQREQHQHWHQRRERHQQRDQHEQQHHSQQRWQRHRHHVMQHGRARQPVRSLLLGAEGGTLRQDFHGASAAVQLPLAAATSREPMSQGLTKTPTAGAPFVPPSRPPPRVETGTALLR